MRDEDNVRNQRLTWPKLLGGLALIYVLALAAEQTFLNYYVFPQLRQQVLDSLDVSSSPLPHEDRSKVGKWIFEYDEFASLCNLRNSCLDANPLQNIDEVYVYESDGDVWKFASVCPVAQCGSYDDHLVLRKDIDVGQMLEMQRGDITLDNPCPESTFWGYKILSCRMDAILNQMAGRPIGLFSHSVYLKLSYAATPLKVIGWKPTLVGSLRVNYVTGAVDGNVAELLKNEL